MKKTLNVALSLALGGFLLWFTLKDLPLADLRAGMTALGTRFRWPLAAGAWLAFLVLMILHGERFRAVLKPVAPLTHVQAFATYMIATLLNVFVPARAGDLYKPLRASRLSKSSFAEAFGLATADLLLWGSGFVIWMGGIALFSWPALGVVPILRWALAGESVAALIGLVLFIAFRERWQKSTAPNNPWLHRGWSFVRGLYESFTPRAARVAVPLAIAGWGCEIVIAMCVGRAFGVEVSFVDGALLMAAVTTAMIIPAPGGVGPFEAAGTFVFVLLGAPKAEAALIAVAYHLVFIATPLILGAACFVAQSLLENEPAIDVTAQ